MKKLFPVSHTNANRSGAGSKEGIAGREYPSLVVQRFMRDPLFREKICRAVGHSDEDVAVIEAGKAIGRYVESVIPGSKTQSKVTLRIRWRDGHCTNFIVKKSSPAQVCLKTVGSFIPEFEAQYNTRIPKKVKDALALFVGEHPRQMTILDAIPVNYVGDSVRDLERKYNNRLTLASMYGYDEKIVGQMLGWLRKNAAKLLQYCFSTGAAKRSEDAAEYLWYHATNKVDDSFSIIHIKSLVDNLNRAPDNRVNSMVCPGDRAQIGSTIDLPFGNLQYHEGSLQFRHDKEKILALQSLSSELKNRKNKFGSNPKESGHRNEIMIAEALNGDKEFCSHFCDRVGKDVSKFLRAEAGGKHAQQEVSVISGRKTPGKTDVAVFWKDGSRTNISVKKRAAGQVYLVTAKNFVMVYEAQYGCQVPSKVCRALAFFIGEDPESRSILDATDLSIDGAETRRLAYRQNYRLMFDVIRNYDERMAKMLLEFLKKKIDSIFELCFAAGAVKDKGLWSNVLWYKNLVDAKGMGLDYLVSIPVVKTALIRNGDGNIVEPGPKNAGSSIHLPFGHLQYHHKQLEFYQEMKSIQSLITS